MALIPVLINAIKEQQNVINKQQYEIEVLKDLLKGIESRLTQLELSTNN